MQKQRFLLPQQRQLPCQILYKCIVRFAPFWHLFLNRNQNHPGPAPMFIFKSYTKERKTITDMFIITCSASYHYVVLAVTVTYQIRIVVDVGNYGALCNEIGLSKRTALKAQLSICALF